MATPPAPLTLRKEDYQGTPDWLPRLFTQLNTFILSVTTGLARDLTRSENLKSVTKMITFTTPGSGTPTVSVKHDLGQKPTDVWVGQLGTSSGAAITAPWSMTWTVDSGGNLSVQFQGLAASTAYKAHLVIE